MELRKMTETVKNLDLEAYILSKVSAAIANGSIIEVTSDKGTASASTMGRLFIESNQDGTGIYYTVKNGNNYSWESTGIENKISNISIDSDLMLTVSYE